MKNLGLDVLEMFARLSEEYRDRQIFRMREGYVPVIKHDIAKRQWAAMNKDKARTYNARAYARKTGKPLPELTVTLVEIFWDGDGWYYAKPHDSERLGGPFEKLHEAWKSADKKRLEVTQVLTTRGLRSYR